jgi:EAL domain-containing protein (putative c-di-GMP-specific phosphodiesterase class I)
VDRLESVERGGLRDSQLIRLRKLGVECSLLGLGLGNMDFATLRRLRATQMKLSETFSGFSYIAGERLLRASVDLGRDLSRSILVPNLTSAADLAAAKVAGIDYGLGKAVGEVMALEELLATIARQRRVS